MNSVLFREIIVLYLYYEHLLKKLCFFCGKMLSLLQERAGFRYCNQCVLRKHILNFYEKIFNFEVQIRKTRDTYSFTANYWWYATVNTLEKFLELIPSSLQ